MQRCRNMQHSCLEQCACMLCSHRLLAHVQLHALLHAWLHALLHAAPCVA